MNDLLEKLLLPIAGEKPCGPDLSYDPRLEELETILKGKPEVDIGSVKKPAEPPDWGQLREKCSEFLKQSKHLRATVMMSCSLLKTGGLAGFADSLQFIRQLLEQQWPGLYPLLDVEDNNDPTQRLNILGSLTAERGAVDGWLTVGEYLYTAPMFRPRGAGPINFDDILAARRRETGTEPAAAGAPDPVRLKEAIRSVGPEALTANRQALQQAFEAVQGIDQFLTTTLGVGNTISFEVLEVSLKEMMGALDAFAPAATVEAGTAADPGTADGQASTGPAVAGVSISGSIRSPDDVVQAIETICEYYRQLEPCSPVPYLLRRAQKLAKMDFVQAVQELSIATVDTLRPSMGSAVDSPPPAEAPQA